MIRRAEMTGCMMTIVSDSLNYQSHCCNNTPHIPHPTLTSPIPLSHPPSHPHIPRPSLTSPVPPSHPCPTLTSPSLSHIPRPTLTSPVPLSHLPSHPYIPVPLSHLPPTLTSPVPLSRPPPTPRSTLTSPVPLSRPPSHSHIPSPTLTSQVPLSLPRPTLTSPVPLLPPLGLACFVYLVMVEGVERSYLPTIVRQDYLLHVNLVHVTTLLGRYGASTS